VTHDSQVSAHADRRVMLRDGMIVEDTMQRPA
jgi:predicted ABC-type transport system involved in lysophospholipase L1 biosynthesis ATPase subunit